MLTFSDSHMVRRPYKIPIMALFLAVLGLLIGELYCGTDLYFASMMALAVWAAGITYNILGGLGTLSGIAFAVLALGSVAISQFAKVLLGQPADSHIAAPGLTATVYATFYVCTIPGAFVFRHFRPPVPRTLEPKSEKQSRALYVIALVLGCVGQMIFSLTNVIYGNSAAETQFNSTHSVGVALAPFLAFAIVIAVDHRIRKTAGYHSFGSEAFLPSIISIVDGMVNTQRAEIIAPFLLYLFTCHLRGFRFRAKHYLAMVCFLLLFVFVISPLELYTRSVIANLYFQDRVARSLDVIAHRNLHEIIAVESAASYSDEFEDYYYLPGTTVLSRFSRIRLDSNLIDACSTDHYGLTAIKTDLLLQVPHFLYKEKPEYGSADFLGRVSGVSARDPWNTEPAFTMIGDSFGAFGFLGVALLGLIVLPLVLRVLESAFDPGQPWGTAALVTCVINAGGTVGTLIAVALIRTPVYFVLASYICTLVAQSLPSFKRSSPGQPAWLHPFGLENFGRSETQN